MRWFDATGTVVAAAVLATTIPQVRVAGATQVASVALELCHRAELEAPEAAREMIERGLRQAEAAVRRNADDPVAHFALFCNLGKRLRARGFSVFMIGDLRRLHRALDRSLTLDPDYADAIAAKGALLYYTPAFAGGDVDAAERYLREALRLDAANPARLVLVELLAYRGAVDEARREAAIAARHIRSPEDGRVRAGARAVLAYMCGGDSGSLGENEVLRELC